MHIRHACRGAGRCSGEILYLDRHSESLVQGHHASPLDDLSEAVDQSCELTGASLSQVSCQPGTGKVEGVHNKQRPGSGQTT